MAQGSNNETVVNKIINLCNQYQTICGKQMCSSVAPSVGVDTVKQTSISRGKLYLTV
jgi:hypothetical protein